MKKTLIIFVLLFSFSVVAEDISDFEIEGMSIGDSLLDYFSKEEIEDNKKFYYDDNTISTSGFKNLHFFETYDWVEFNYKTKDRNYIIIAINGVVEFRNDIDGCKKLQKKISLTILNLFNNKIKFIENVSSHPADASGESITISKYSSVGTNTVIIQCLDWSNKMGEAYGYFDHLKVGLMTEVFYDWLHTKAYN